MSKSIFNDPNFGTTSGTKAHYINKAMKEYDNHLARTARADEDMSEIQYERAKYLNDLLDKIDNDYTPRWLQSADSSRKKSGKLPPLISEEDGERELMKPSDFKYDIGDEIYYKNCHGKIQDRSSLGRHNVYTIKCVCNIKNKSGKIVREIPNNIFKQVSEHNLTLKSKNNKFEETDNKDNTQDDESDIDEEEFKDTNDGDDVVFKGGKRKRNGKKSRKGRKNKSKKSKKSRKCRKSRKNKSRRNK